MSQYLTLLIYAAYPRFPSHPSKLCTLHINLIHLASIFDLMFRTLLLCPEIANGGWKKTEWDRLRSRDDKIYELPRNSSHFGASREPTLSSFVFVQAENTFPRRVSHLCGFSHRPNCNLLVQAVKNQLQAMCGCEIAFTFYSSMLVGPSAKLKQSKSGRSTAITGAAPEHRKHNFRTLSRT